MTRRMFSREFKQEAVDLVKQRGVSAAQASRDLGIYATVLRRWVRASEADGPAALPGNGRLTPEQEELRSLRREVSKLKAERDILKKGETIFRHWSEGNGRTPTSPRTSCDVWVCGEAPRVLASELDV